MARRSGNGRGQVQEIKNFPPPNDIIDMCRPHGYVNVETPGESKLFGELIIDNV